MSFAQNTANTLPDSGNVGIGITAPTCKFEVKGQTHLMSNLKIDSSVAISDSAKVGQNLKIGGDAYIEKNLTVNGKSNFNQPVYLNYLNNSDTTGIDTSIYNVESILGVSTTTSAVDTKIKITFPKPPIEYNYCQFKTLPFSLSKLINTDANNSDVSLCPEFRNVGLGTTEPQAKLDISVDGGNGLKVVTNEGFDYGYGVQSVVSNVNTKAFAVDNSTISGTDQFVVYGDGRTGINTGSPDAKFSVFTLDTTKKCISVIARTVNDAPGSAKDQFVVYGNGHCYAREFTAELGTFTYPDYVFKKNYNLMPLNALDKFVKRNHHLPSIPSAKEVKANKGINVGEMEEKLLKKVEELTLYTIQQQKEIDALKAKIKTMNN